MNKVTVIFKNGNQITTSKWNKVDDLIMSHEISYCVINGVITFNADKVYKHLNK